MSLPQFFFSQNRNQFIIQSCIHVGVEGPGATNVLKPFLQQTHTDIPFFPFGINTLLLVLILTRRAYVPTVHISTPTLPFGVYYNFVIRNYTGRRPEAINTGIMSVSNRRGRIRKMRPRQREIMWKDMFCGGVFALWPWSRRYLERGMFKIKDI